MTITEFLLARIAEDEDLARRAVGGFAERTDLPTKAVMRSASGEALFEFDEKRMVESDRTTLDLAEHLCQWQPARVLAECAAKRAIIDRFPSDGDPGGDGYNFGIEYAIYALAAVYADHLDYDEAWRI